MNKTSVIDAIWSLKPEYKSYAITVAQNNNVIEDMDINWAGATPISNEDLQAEYDRLIANEVNYIEPRRLAYPSIADQLDMMWHDKQNDTTTWEDAIAKVKNDNPKESE